MAGQRIAVKLSENSLDSGFHLGTVNDGHARGISDDDNDSNLFSCLDSAAMTTV